MALLDVPYLETPYRLFGSRCLRSVVDAQSRLLRAPNRALPSSGMDGGPGELNLPGDVAEKLWNATRLWATRYVLKEEALTPWGSAWMDHGLSTLPRASSLAPMLWDPLIEQWMGHEYLEMCARAWRDVEFTPTQSHQYWTVVWSQFARQAGHATPEGFDAAIGTVANAHPRKLSVLSELHAGLKELCVAAGVEVRGPSWAFHWMTPEAAVEPEEEPLWAFPLDTFGYVAGRGIGLPQVEAYQADTAMWERLADIACQGSKRNLAFEFWYPVAHYQAPSPGTAPVTERARVVAVTAEEAARLSGASGVTGLGPVAERQTFVVVRMDAPDFEAALIQARYEPEQVLARLRPADTRFHWPLADYVYWTVDLPEAGGAFMAQWRDPYLLHLPIPVDYVAQVHAWTQQLANLGGDLAESVVRAFHWQGVAYSQMTREGELLAWWIPIECMGEGDYKVADNVGRLAGAVWHHGMWPSLPADERRRGLEQDAARMTHLVHELKKARNVTVHTGRLPRNLDVDYVLWLMRHLAHDLTEVLVTLIRQHDVRSRSDLTTWLKNQTHEDGTGEAAAAASDPG